MKKTLSLFTMIAFSITSFSINLREHEACKKKKLQTYEIGQEAQGGIIFYVSKSKTHGLVAALKDQMENSNYQDCIDAINDPSHHDLAGAEYTDWRLPKLWEAYKLYMNLHMINLGNFSEAGYWTSKETIGFEKIHVFNFSKGVDFASQKSETFRARGVRTF